MNSENEELSIASEKIVLELARFLLQNDLNYKEFSKISRRAFVKAGVEILEQKDQNTLGRLAEVTGLSRLEIARVDSEAKISKSESEKIWTSVTRALHRWYTKPEFLDKTGQPRELDLSEPETFMQIFGVGIDKDKDGDSLVGELVDVGSIEQMSDRSWKPITRYYIPKKLDWKIGHFGRVVSRLIATLNRNINNPSVDPWLERVVGSAELKMGSGPLFTRVGKEQALKFLESLDDWMSSNEERSQEINLESDRVGIGVYYFEEIR